MRKKTFIYIFIYLASKNGDVIFSVACVQEYNITFHILTQDILFFVYECITLVLLVCGMLRCPSVWDMTMHQWVFGSQSSETT